MRHLRTLFALAVVAAIAVAAAGCSSASSSSAKNPTAPPSFAGTPVSPPTAPRAPSPPAPLGVEPGISFVDATHGWLVQSTSTGSALLATTDGGQTWKTHDLGSLFVTASAFTDQMHGWIAGISSPDGCGSPPLPCYTLQTTADGGQTWTVVKLPNNLSVLQIAAVSPKDAWIVQGYCEDDDCARWTTEIYRTPNGGATWDSLDSLDSTEITLVRFDATTSWIITDSYVYRIGDPTAGYAAASNNPCHILYPGWGPRALRQGSVSFADATHGWMLCRGAGGGGTAPGVLFGTEDGGATWDVVSASAELRLPVPPGTGDFPISAGDDMRFGDAQGGWLGAGVIGIVSRTSNGGRTWELVEGASFDTIVFADATSICGTNYAQLVCSTDSGQHWTTHDLPK
ncbi:MAG TPA: YCF48-related protein [Dehalococcoidia bacterium]|jgi:photosystem II stability/assembly factor-like uncharacterized protein|nr:YCF48-related protein [Dehalococcoidia bacterium]